MQNVLCVKCNLTNRHRKSCCEQRRTEGGDTITTTAAIPLCKMPGGNANLLLKVHWNESPRTHVPEQTWNLSTKYSRLSLSTQPVPDNQIVEQKSHSNTAPCIFFFCRLDSLLWPACSLPLFCLRRRSWMKGRLTMLGYLVKMKLSPHNSK